VAPEAVRERVGERPDQVGAEEQRVEVEPEGAVVAGFEQEMAVLRRDQPAEETVVIYAAIVSGVCWDATVGAVRVSGNRPSGGGGGGSCWSSRRPTR